VFDVDSLKFAQMAIIFQMKILDNIKPIDGTGRKKICIVTSSFPLNREDARASAGLFVLDFSLVLAELGHRVTVVTPDKSPGQKEAFPGISVHWFPWRGGAKVLAAMKPYNPGDALAFLSLFRSGTRYLEDLVENEGFDHIMAMWAVPAGYLAMGLRKRHGIPYTTWCLGTDIWAYGRYPILKGIVKRAIKASDLVFADGIKLAEDVTRLTGRSCPFMASSRRLNRFLIRPLDLPTGYRFLFIGRYAKVKGVDILLEAMEDYIGQGNKGRLYMFGGGPLNGFVHQRAAGKNFQGRVDVGGFANEETVVSYLNACDCLIIPSRLESIPVILSDALQMGKPVIATDVGDMGKIIRKEGAGLVVPPESSRGLCRAMREMADGKGVECVPGVKKLADEFDIKRVASEWLGKI
jgi:glycosyltransferase involved in cell wall biosynthesis